MAKNLYLISRRIQKSIHCRILEEKKYPQPGITDFLLELYEPISRLIYYGFPSDEPDEQRQPMARFLFSPHVPQDYQQTGPFQGSICSFKNETMASIDNYDRMAEDRAILCVSEEQAQKYLQFLEKAKKTVYDPCIREDRKRSQCRIIEDLTLDHKKGYWLAELDPPALTKEGQEFSRVFFFLKDMPLPGQIIPTDYILLREDEVEDFLGPRIKREYQSDEISILAPDYKI